MRGGVHEITKATNYWFDREVGALERDARALAADWASKGLPRHDVARRRRSRSSSFSQAAAWRRFVSGSIAFA